MPFVTEVTARLENKPGRLAKICAAMAQEKINIRALSVMDSGERSVLRMIAEPVESARQVLTSLGVEADFSEVLSEELDNKPGALARLLQRFADEHINVEYAYTSASGPGKALGIFQVDNAKKAIQVLSHASGPSTVSDRDSGRRPLHSR
ncbi:ACT domain-containing protein [Tautonia sociabilis]|uniref:ACT domain-containing protein n=1 Tax=Tautonia sociabilis TaxID=2080755 RepID=A0A432MJX1_9BACT|nr:ACT domain-containing protein [Tautonia sociabilis]RUL87703.1 ACT domain-containing protein [Tautonia sociabilis]